ncbi:MAG: transglutaminase-like domain-containing protein [Terriglobales bacterium]
MIARVYPDSYDAVGRGVFRPDLRRKGIKPTFPFGRYFSRPVTVKCESIADVRKFLATCRGVGDKEQFARDDYWQPPEEFEQRRKGDCDDYAMWTWRQLLSMGYNARFVMGRAGRFGIGHAWVTYEREGGYYLVEPTFWFLGERMPTLSTARYKPKFSVSWDGERAHWFQHQELAFRVDGRLPHYLLDWIKIWGRFLIRALPRIPRMLYRKLFVKRSTTSTN